MNALIIDDSLAMRRILGKIVKRLGFDVLEAEDGAKGLEMFQENYAQIEVTLVDWNMPVMDGLSFIEAVRADDRFTTDKLVMVTTETEPGRMTRALMAGVDEFVMKPFTTEILVDKLKLIGVRIPTPAEA
ncbi:MAG: two-component system chemotaxis response regulator CheY [Planctomycetaceae bacterium]|jgi:two-component system chemotaxis response regulator CheY